MASDDFSGVSAAVGGPYVVGEPMTLTVSGQNRHTVDATTTQETVTISAVIQSESGVQYTLTAEPQNVTRTVPGAVTFEDVTIVSVTDTGNRAWMVSGRTATAIA